MLGVCDEPAARALGTSDLGFVNRPTLIAKPRQIAQAASFSRNDHNTMRSQMNLTVAEFDAFVDVINESVELNLDVSQPWSKQTNEAKAAHINWVAYDWDLSSRYVDNWPIEAYTTKHAKLASRQTTSAKDIPGGKNGSPRKRIRTITAGSPQLVIIRPKSRLIYVGKRPPMAGRARSRSLTPEPESRDDLPVPFRKSSFLYTRRDPTSTQKGQEPLIELGVYDEQRLQALATGPPYATHRIIQELQLDLLSSLVLEQGLLDLAQRQTCIGRDEEPRKL